MSIQYACGCLNEIDEASGVTHCIEKCRTHRKQAHPPETAGETYYEHLGVIRDGKPAATKHVAELEEALGPIERAGGYLVPALEIGCGASQYVSALRDAGWSYCGVDASPWACRWMRETHDANMMQGDWETMPELPDKAGLILSAHALEHMANAPNALSLMAQTLEPGGVLYLVVPDDEDPTNSDHLWFFDRNTLKCCIESAGLIVERLEKRRYVKHENFLYARARKPC